jgi:hypothetical protein
MPLGVFQTYQCSSLSWLRNSDERSMHAESQGCLKYPTFKLGEGCPALYMELEGPLIVSDLVDSQRQVIRVDIFFIFP